MVFLIGVVALAFVVLLYFGGPVIANALLERWRNRR